MHHILVSGDCLKQRATSVSTDIRTNLLKSIIYPLKNLRVKNHYP